MKLQEIDPQERPREKALRHGIESLSNRELLAVLLQSGTRQKSALDLADDVLRQCKTLDKLMQMDPRDLMHLHGIKEVRAIQLFAGIELAKRIQSQQVERYVVHTAEDLIGWLQLCYGHEQQEHFIAVYLNQRNCIIHHQVLFLGTLQASTVHPREIFKEALRYSASSIICVHNHPGGDPTPSLADRNVTRHIAQSGEMIGIPLLDHLIIAQQAWFSFRQSGLL